MIDPPTFRGVPIEWVESLDKVEPKTFFTRDPADMTANQRRLLAWFIGQGPYPGRDIVAGAESREP